MIAVIDYGIGNVRSVLNALEYIGASATLTRDHSLLADASGLVLPGVGAFGEGMRRLEELGLSDQLVQLANSGKPILGICLGFQMLMRSSTEQGEFKGLNLIDYSVIRLPVDARLPHIGWSSVNPVASSPAPRLLEGLEGQLFYFVHSYGVLKPPGPMVAGLSRYGDCEFIALIESGNMFGTQFHPEKSGEAGLALLHNFVKFCQ